MKFTSTRDSNVHIDSKNALLKGISDEGGLFIPEEFPRLGEIETMLSMEYKELAYHILENLFTDFSSDELLECVNGAYNDVNFSNPHIAPIKKISDRYFVELHHGRTSAFKDMALSVFPYFVQTALKSSTDFEEIVILVATSGDTGKAALEGFKDINNIKITVLYPEDGVSSIQKRQMQTQEGDNTYVLGVVGNFDDCQTAVKEIFMNREFNRELNNQRIQLSSANSINVGRFLPQIVYYYSSYIDLVNAGEIANGEKVNIVVPTGNFGNILAAYYGMEMGLPINNLICASNDNNVLTEFLNEGVYNKNRDLILTTSPSMDVLVSSNVERFLYHMSNNDTKIVSSLMNELNESGSYEVSDEIKSNMNFVKAYYANEDEVNKKVLQTLEDEAYLIDTHTAVASVAYDKYLADTDDMTKTIIASTASPYKFTSDILKALSVEIDGMDDFEIMGRLSSFSSTEIPVNLSDLENKAIRFRDISSKDEILDRIKDFIGGDENA
ncbi:MAG: threonine synthase [Tissierellia bacterium]|nr:threonine synthase [Tissierellia bacterium]